MTDFIKELEWRGLIHDKTPGTEEYLGSGKKILTRSERENIDLVRKSIVASRNITKGEKFSSANLTTKRPGYGTSPMRWEKVINKTSKRNYKKNDFI